MVATIDIFGPVAFADGFPHAAFAELRAEDPVHWTEEPLTPEYPWMTEPGPGHWAVARYADVDRVLRDPGLFSSHVGTSLLVEPANSGGLALFQRQMINMDPPEHSRLRRIINRAFTPRAVEQLRDHIVRYTAEILTAAEERGEVEFVTSVSAELPLLMLCEMLGVPRVDRSLLFDWTSRLTSSGESVSDDGFEDYKAAGREMAAYCAELTARRRREPTADIWSSIVNAEFDNDALSDEEILMYWDLLVVAGNETTRNTISGGVIALDQFPDQRRRVVDDPALVPSAVEEILRWVSPVQHFRRTTTADTDLGGKRLTAGDKVVVYYPSANRDESQFAEPFRFDVSRTPNPHLAFGAGPHFCLGSSLARLQLRVMFGALIARFPEFQVSGPVERTATTFLAGIRRLPVALRPG